MSLKSYPRKTKNLHSFAKLMGMGEYVGKLGMHEDKQLDTWCNYLYKTFDYTFRKKENKRLFSEAASCCC